MIPDTSIAGEISKLTGISKRELAKWLNMDQSSLSKCKMGHRGMPVNAGGLVIDMHMAIEKLIVAEVAPQSDIKKKKKLQSHAANCRRRCYLLQTKLDKMKLAYKQGATRLALMETHLPNKYLPILLRQNWIEDQRFFAKKIMEKNGWFAQMQVTIRMTLLEQEAVLYETALLL